MRGSSNARSPEVSLVARTLQAASLRIYGLCSSRRRLAPPLTPEGRRGRDLNSSSYKVQVSG